MHRLIVNTYSTEKHALGVKEGDPAYTALEICVTSCSSSIVVSSREMHY
jgi:hypothetical protein